MVSNARWAKARDYGLQLLDSLSKDSQELSNILGPAEAKVRELYQLRRPDPRPSTAPVPNEVAASVSPAAQARIFRPGGALADVERPVKRRKGGE